MRERSDLRRHAMLRQGAGDLFLPHRRPDQPFMKSISLAQLEANPVNGIAKVPRRGIRPEGVQNAPLVRVKIIGRTRGEPLQQGRIPGFRLGDPLLAMRGRICGIETQYLIDQAEIPVIVQQALVGGDLGIDANPEAHILFELRRLHERIGRFGTYRGADEKRRKQEPERSDLE